MVNLYKTANVCVSFNNYKVMLKFINSATATCQSNLWRQRWFFLISAIYDKWYGIETGHKYSEGVVMSGGGVKLDEPLFFWPISFQQGFHLAIP